jgi:hypothetical protein
VTPNGFVLCFKTWNESLVFDAEATWIAIGRPALK